MAPAIRWTPPQPHKPHSTASGMATNYAYDPIYELSTVTQGSTTKESYSYDATGNRLSALGSYKLGLQCLE